MGRWLGETYSMPVIPDPEADELPEAGDFESENSENGPQ